MLTREVKITVFGDPKPKGSMKCVGGRGRHQLVNNSPDVQTWQDTVEKVATKVQQRAEAGQAIALHATVTVQRPRDHYRTGQHAGELKPWALEADVRPVGRGTGDGDKHLRALADALEAAGVLHDDAQVTEFGVRKAYVGALAYDALDYPGVVIRLYPVGATS